MSVFCMLLIDMTTIVREYEYRPRWKVIIFVATFFGVCSIFFGHRAVTNEQGLVVNGIISLSPNTATIFYWVLCGLGVGFVAISALMVVHRFTSNQCIVITELAIVLPTSRWLSEQTTIPFDDIESLFGNEVFGQRFLYIFRKDGMRFTVHASMMPTNGAFDELRDLLRHALERIGGQGASGQPR
ncbi:MAG: hypothetical protein DWQ42_03475 [Planctomycetota bacterium]|nr:MAG: hypothetical protein DWQ42_03475 [Planctomycetota bacterium]